MIGYKNKFQEKLLTFSKCLDFSGKVCLFLCSSFFPLFFFSFSSNLGHFKGAALRNNIQSHPRLHTDGGASGAE